MTGLGPVEGILFTHEHRNHRRLDLYHPVPRVPAVRMGIREDGQMREIAYMAFLTVWIFGPLALVVWLIA